MEDYKPTSIHVEDFQPNLKESSQENVQDVIDIPLEGHYLMEVGSQLISQDDEPMDFQT